MKKLLLILLFVGLGLPVLAAGYYYQNNWRWRNDDGTESSATFKADENTEITLNNTDIIRLRVEIYREDLQGPATPAIPILRYYSTANTTAVEITTDPQTTDAFYLTTSAHDVSGNTTNLLTDKHPQTSIGKVYGQQATDPLDFPANTSAELEWILKPTAHIVPGETYYFEIGDYVIAATPTLKVAATLPVNLVSYTAKANANAVKLQWTVASETDNSHFTIAHSTDGKDFTTLGTEKSKGSGKGEYTFTHYAPCNGTNYYRLSQTDIDGKTKILGTKAVSFTLAQTAVSITPNPADGNNIIIRLAVVDKKQYHVRLFDISGKKLLDKHIAPMGSQLFLIPDRPLASGTYIADIEGLGSYKVAVK